MVIAIGAMIAAVILFLGFSGPEPKYKGQSLSYWLEAYGRGDDRSEPEEAIQHIGTNAFPLLLQWIREPERKQHPFVLRIAGMLPRPLRPRWARDDYVSRSYLSACAFYALRAQADLVIPELSKFAENRANPEAAGHALEALRYIGPNGVPALLSAVRDASHPYRPAATFALGRNGDLGPHTDSVVSELIARLDDSEVGDCAATALMLLKHRPDLVVPALGRRLENTNNSSKTRVVAANCLFTFGHDAAPYLTNALNDSDSAVRWTVVKAMNELRSDNK